MAAFHKCTLVDTTSKDSQEQAKLCESSGQVSTFKLAHELRSFCKAKMSS